MTALTSECDFLEFLCPGFKRTVSFCFPLSPWNSAMRFERVQEALSINPSGEDWDLWLKSQLRLLQMATNHMNEAILDTPGLPGLQVWSPLFSVLSKFKICYILPEISWFCPPPNPSSYWESSLSSIPIDTVFLILNSKFPIRVGLYPRRWLQLTDFKKNHKTMNCSSKPTYDCGPLVQYAVTERLG